MKVEQLPNGEYIVGDVTEVMAESDWDASAIFLDDAWSRPQRNGEFGVEYPTHALDKTKEIIDLCWDSLEEGGWFIADADDWLLPRMVNYLREEYGDCAETYDGGGFRKIGGVTYVNNSGEPLRNTAGEYFSNGGYHAVFAHKGETDRGCYKSAKQVATRNTGDYGRGSVKPTKPYRRWVKGIMKPKEHLLVPCAGTAPAAIGQLQSFGDGANYTCIDIEEGAREAFKSRRRDEVSIGNGAVDW